MAKVCKKCNTNKPLGDFFTASKYKDKQYYRGECKQCTRKDLSSDSGKEAQARYRNSDYGKVIKSAYKKRKEYRNKQTQYTLDRRATDPFFKTKFNLRVRLRQALLRSRWSKTYKFAEYIGCDRDTLIAHFESKFAEGMTWENQGKWHIDHIIPLSSANSEEELYKLCHFLNLQPLWAEDNIKKSDNY